MQKLLPFSLCFSLLLPLITGSAKRWHDTTTAGLHLPHETLWHNLQVPNVIDFLFVNHISNYTKTSPDSFRLALPSGESLRLSRTYVDRDGYQTIITITPSANALLKNFRGEVEISFQAYPYLQQDETAFSLLETSFRIFDSRREAVNVVKAFVRSLHDTLRQTYGAYPCMQHYRTYGGTCNNNKNPSWGAYKTPLRRLDNGLKDPAFKPGTNAYAKELPNARTISRTLFSQQGERKSKRRVSMLAVFWGQFIDHDIDLTPETGHGNAERMDIVIEDEGDVMYNRHNKKLEFSRSVGVKDVTWCCGRGVREKFPREQMNAVSGFIDGSQVYGCERDRVSALRKGENGELWVEESSDGRHMLPKNNVNKLGIKLDNAPSDSDDMYVAGDIRVNEQPVLASIHAVFVREHNRLAKQLRQKLNCRGEERVFQYSRRIIAAQIQYITYNFFLPALLGKKHGLDEYRGYRPGVNPSISNFFSTAAFRVGHSMVSNTLKILEKGGRPHAKDGILLHETFFNPSFVEEIGIEPLLLGSSHQIAEAVDTSVVNSLQNELFKKLTGGIDLVARNIQRGRDHGLPGYNDARELHGLKRVKSFKEISSDKTVQWKLAKVYKSVDDIDPFVGGLAEDPLEDSELGPLFSRAVGDQFGRLRDGDRFFYANLEWPEDIATLEEVQEITEGRLTLESIIVRNSGGTLSRDDFPKNIFIGN